MVRKDCPIVVCGKTMCVNLVELPMNDFDIIFCMDWLHKCYAFMYFCSRVGRFCFPNEVEVVLEGYNSSHSSPLILNLKANKVMYNGLLCNLMSVNDLDHEISSIDFAPVVNEFQDVFPDDFPRVPPHREIDFCIDLNPNT